VKPTPPREKLGACKAPLFAEGFAVLAVITELPQVKLSSQSCRNSWIEEMNTNGDSSEIQLQSLVTDFASLKVTWHLVIHLFDPFRFGRLVLIIFG
jgi:hypothetical protein